MADSFESRTAAEIGGLSQRRLVTGILLYVSMACIPLCCVVPCGIGLAFQKNELVYNIFMVSAIALPLVALATMVLMLLDRSRYARAWGIAQYALKNHYAYAYDPDLESFEFLSRLQLFATGEGSVGANLVQGKFKKQPFTFVDYGYYVGFGQYQTTYTQTILVLHDGAVGAPIFVLYPAGWTDRLSKFLGGETIEIDGETQFNRTFILSGKRVDDILECFSSQKLIDYCLEEPKLAMEVNSDDLILFRDNRLLQPGEYKDFLHRAIKMAAIVRGES